MDTKIRFPETHPERTVYVRSVKHDELPKELKAQVAPGKNLFAIHKADGECLALTRDRYVAFAMARSNEMAPVSVH
ncbi:MAG: DUF1150 family protein [Rhodobacteraceae bacterium]|nr:DUF1150 family protein [Paracoccaceae bacterium]